MSKLDQLYCDVLVAGGGAAGIAAAVSAARSGADVMLLEKNSFLGGKATAAYVGTLCGLYYCSHNPVSRFVSEGFSAEFAERVSFKSNTSPLHNKYGLHYLPYSPFDFKLVADDYIVTEKINPFFHTTVCGVEVNNNRIIKVRALCYDRLVEIIPKAVIDTTGEALTSILCQQEYIESESYQSPAQVFSMTNVNAVSESNLGMIILKELQKAIDERRLSAEYSSVSIVPGSLKNNQVYIKIGLPFQLNNDLNKISRLELSSRAMVLELSGFLKQTILNFEQAQLSDVAIESGVRTNRRHLGKHILTKQEVLTSKKLNDSIARGSWPIEFWGIGKRVQLEFMELDTYYDIPQGCLCSPTILNLFFAGRNISATEEAIASARVIGTCLQTGFSAGKLAVKEGRV